MSLFKYFQRKEIPKEESLTAAYESLKGNPPECITVEEIESVQKILQNKKLYVFGEKEKQEIAKFEVAAAVRKFKKNFPTLTESTIRPWVKRYKENLKEKRKANKFGLDSKLRAMIISLRTARAGINHHVVRGVLIGLVQSCPEKFGKYVNFEVTRSWVRFLYQRMKFSRRAATTSIPVITRSLWNEIKSQFLQEISQKVLLHSIPDELTINADQTLSKFVATDKHNHGSQGTKAYFKGRFQ